MPIWGEAELLCRAVYEEAEALAEEIMAQAGIEAERIVAEAEKKAEREYQERSLAQKIQASDRARRMIDTAELNARKRITGLREQVMTELLKGLASRLKTAKERPNYNEFLIASVKEGIEALKGSEYIVEMNPADAERAKGRIERLAEERSLKVDLKSSPSIEGGCRIYSGDRRRLYDNTLSARLKRREEEIRKEIWSKIFGRGEAGT